MSILTDIHDSMYKAIEEFFYPHMKEYKLNYDLEGTIISVLGNNQYTVKINNIAYSIPAPAIPICEYKVGMIVKIEVPNQNFSKKYIKGQQIP